MCVNCVLLKVFFLYYFSISFLPSVSLAVGTLVYEAIFSMYSCTPIDIYLKICLNVYLCRHILIALYFKIRQEPAKDNSRKFPLRPDQAKKARENTLNVR
ncbi:hypothetical protein V1511DRAFT_500765 [Dipodascopsis uninucleata]